MSKSEIQPQSHTCHSIRANGGAIRSRRSANKEEILIYGGEKERKTEYKRLPSVKGSLLK
jgi:hypothetical protein